VLGQPADGGRVAAAVVVDDDDHWALGCRDVVQRLPAHPTGQRAVADDGHHVPVSAARSARRPSPSRRRRTAPPRRGWTPPSRGRSLHATVAREAALAAQGVEVGPAAGQHLVDIGLMAGVEDDRVGAGIRTPGAAPA